MKFVTIIVEFAENNLSAYPEGITGVGVTADDVAGIKKSMKEALDFLVESCKEGGYEVPEQLQGDYELVYKYDMRSFLCAYSKVISKSGLEHLTGIHQKQLWHYASGQSTPKQATKEKIQAAIHQLGKELCAVEFA